jgi:multiple sugar transport system ATP-binding protein
MADVTLRKVVKRYDEVEAVRGIDLDIADHEFVVLVGPSGCGKSTTLRMIAGLEDISDGDIMIGGDVVNDVPPKDRDIAMVFQNYALYPHMTVAENMSFGLRLKRYPKAEIKTRIDEAARMLDIVELVDRKPKQLSGGQRQRVAMGRAIVRNPKAFLMDEPLSNLDAKLRVGMRASLAQLHRRLGTTTVYVTHDQVEAMTLGQRVAVMRDGRILQVDAPQRLYQQPRDLFVAGFIGSPAMNLVEATIDGDEVSFGQFRVALDPERRPTSSSTRSVVLGVRPESFEDSLFASHDLPALEVEVAVLEELGSDAHVFFPVDAPPIAPEALEDEGEEDARLIASEGALLNARIDSRTRARVGGSLRLVVDPARFHFFDPETGASLLRPDPSMVLTS